MVSRKVIMLCVNHNENLVACKRVGLVIGKVDVELYYIIVFELVKHIVNRLLMFNCECECGGG